MSPTSSVSSTSSGDGLSPAPRAAARFSRFTRATRWLRRITFLVHRWLGIALALLMAVWAVSGITMMYVSFPETSVEERVAGLQSLDLSGCCEQAPLPEGAIESARVEMIAGTPVLRWSTAVEPGMQSLDGTPILIGQREAALIAQSHMHEAFGSSLAPQVEPIDRDQWTVYGRFREHAPLYKASFDDARGSVLYVSGATGEVVQDTSRHERFWNWLGAVPHWLYFTAFREVQPLWYNFVIYASLLGAFLTVTGIYVGIRMYGRGRRKSPFRGLALWHHWTGLVFGVVTLTWVVSGLASMNPWGWLESGGPGAEMTALAGRSATTADVELLYRSLAAAQAPEVVSAELNIQDGRPWAVLAYSDGRRQRVALPTLEPASLSKAELSALAARARPERIVQSQGLITNEDAYHYGHHTSVVLPAWRIIFAGEDHTRFYFDPRTGELINFADAPSRAYRWWHYGLHRLDFPILRQRPLWDIVVVPLMIGVSLLCIIGFWLGMRRLRINFRRTHVRR